MAESETRLKQFLNQCRERFSLSCDVCSIDSSHVLKHLAKKGKPTDGGIKYGSEVDALIASQFDRVDADEKRKRLPVQKLGF